MSKKQINSVSVKQAVTNSNANSTIKLSAIDVLKKFNKSTEGLLRTSLGKKTEIYNETLFADLEEKQKKSTRKRFRNYTFNLLDEICKTFENNDKEKTKKLVSIFKEFYKEVYKVNDFSFSSIASENTKEIKKNVLIKGLEICKKF